MDDMITLLLIAFCCYQSNEIGAVGCAKYARFLMHKYGSLNSKEKKQDCRINGFIPYGRWYDRRYKSSRARKRFYAFLWLSRILITLFDLWCLITLGVLIISYTTGNIFNDTSLMIIDCFAGVVVVADFVATISLVPFGYISHIWLTNSYLHPVRGRQSSMGDQGWIG